MNPAVLDEMSWAMAEVYAAVTDRILINLARHFPYVREGAEIPGAFEYQARMLAQVGQVNQESIRIIAESLGGADEALRGVLERAILEGLRNEEPQLRRAAERGLLTTPARPEMTASMTQAFQSYYRQSADRLNLVNTVMLESTQAAYTGAVSDAAAQILIAETQRTLNVAAGEVITGVSSYNQAMRTAVDRMVNNGLTGFVDHAGRHWSPEAYVAMDIRTTTANTARAAVWERNQDYGNDLYQVSSHQGARPLCYPWQGKIISTSGRTGVTEDLDGNKIPIHSEDEIESFRYGGGLFGVNCGHYPMCFIPGFSTLKGEPQDEEANAKTYAESQQQRALERKLREEKRDLEVMKAQGAPEDQIKAQRQRVRDASADIDDFCEQTGRARHRDREGAPVRATWPSVGGEVTRYNGGYIGTDVVPPPKRMPTPKTSVPAAPIVGGIVTPNATSRLATEVLPNSGVQAVPFERWDHTPTHEEIIANIAGGDQTSGSCASVSLAYAGNRAGYDVHDFRGGNSCSWFATKRNTQMLAELPEISGTIINSRYEIRTANQLLASMEEGREYWLGIGRHASIVRRVGGQYQFLELQSATSNGWKALDNNVLRWRFGCVQRRSMALPARLMDVERLMQSEDFAAVLQYINTPVGAEMRGVSGGIK